MLLGGGEMDGGEGWMGCGALIWGAQSARGGGLRCGSGRSPQKINICIIGLRSMLLCVCVCLFYVPPSSDLVKDVCESLFDNVTKG